MPREKIENLERLVGELIAEMDRLEAENSGLHGQIATLEGEGGKARAENRALSEKLAALKTLEASHRKLEKSQGMLRIKVQGLLDNLEKMDIP